MADHQPSIHALRESTKLLGLGQSQRKRLLDKDVFACLHSVASELGMQNGWRGDRHAGDVGIAQDHFKLGDGDTISIAEFVRSCAIGITDRRERNEFGEVTD
jgi:hypothetical protein